MAINPAPYIIEQNRGVHWVSGKPYMGLITLEL